MDATLGLLWLVTNLADLTVNHCPEGCLRTEIITPQVVYQVGELQSDELEGVNEFYVGYDSHRRRGPSRPTYGLSVTSDGSAWFGVGGKWSSEHGYDSPFFIETSMMPGFYRQGDGADLDGILQFRAALGLGYMFENGSKLMVVYDSMSNADFFDDSPSRETLSIRWTTNWEGPSLRSRMGW